MKAYSCFNCGAEVGKDDWDEIGFTRVWVCSESECVRELREQNQIAEADRYERAAADDYMRY